MNTDKMAAILTDLRKKRNLTQSDVASAVDVSPSAYGMYETGDRIPRDEVKVRIAEFFGVSVQSIFFA